MMWGLWSAEAGWRDRIWVVRKFGGQERWGHGLLGALASRAAARIIESPRRQYNRAFGALRPYPALRMRNRKTPASSRHSTSSSPVVSQKDLKSATAPGSVALTSRISPPATPFIALRARSTGSGHLRPVASRSEEHHAEPPSLKPL